LHSGERLGQAHLLGAISYVEFFVKIGQSRSALQRLGVVLFAHFKHPHDAARPGLARAERRGMEKISFFPTEQTTFGIKPVAGRYDSVFSPSLKQSLNISCSLFPDRQPTSVSLLIRVCLYQLTELLTVDERQVNSSLAKRSPDFCGMD
jgi:hypothetical protein